MKNVAGIIFENRIEGFKELLFKPVTDYIKENLNLAGVENVTVVSEENPCEEISLEGVDKVILSLASPFVTPKLIGDILDILDSGCDAAALTQGMLHNAKLLGYENHRLTIKSNDGNVFPSVCGGMFAVNTELLKTSCKGKSFSNAGEIIAEILKNSQKYSFKNCKPHELITICDSRSYKNACDEERKRVFNSLYEKGVILYSEDGIIVSPDCEIGEGTVILPGTIIKNGSRVGCNCVIGPNSMLDGAVIGDKCHIKATWVTRSTLMEDVQIGPFSQVRPDCVIDSGVRIGDFVEVKNSKVGKNTHASHLTYIGDTDCGSGVNFGCGVVTVNYNGKVKNRTTIGDNCFIGCNTNLIAPVKVGNGGYTAAGSTVTVDVPEDALCIARAREVIKEGRAVNYKKIKK